MEKILKKKPVFQGRVLSVSEVDIDFDNGNMATFEIASFSAGTGVAALVLDEEENVYFVEQYRLGIDQKTVSIPSGGLDGKDPYVQIDRELQEEIGYKASSIELMFRAHSNPGYIDSAPAYVFLATNLTPSKIQGDEIEDIRLVKIPFNQALQMVKEGKFIDSKTIQAILYYQQFIRKQ